jgi:hypothetical protein
MGAVNVRNRTYLLVDDGQMVHGTLSLSSSYATNGDTYTSANFGLARIDRLMLGASGGYTFTPDYTNSKIKSYTTATTETGAVDLSALLVDYIAIGA